MFRTSRTHLITEGTQDSGAIHPHDVRRNWYQGKNSSKWSRGHILIMNVNLTKARNAVLMNGHEQMKYIDTLKEDPEESDDFELEIGSFRIRFLKYHFDFQLNHSNLKTN